MKPYRVPLVCLVPVLAFALPLGGAAAEAQVAQPTANASAADAAAAWQALSQAEVRPVQPPEWREKRPEQSVIDAWVKVEKERLGKLAKDLLDFQTRFPKDANISDAQIREFQALMFVAQFGDEAAAKRMEEIEEVQLKDPSKTPQQRFDIRASQIQRKRLPRDEGEKAARDLMKEFPGIADVYGLLLDSAEPYLDARSRAIAEEVLKSNAADHLKDDARALMTKIDAIGKPLDMKFTAIDGREVNVQAMKGKVILVDFWAAWCGPCVRELPNVKAAYDKLHEKGFEILGISFDVDKARLEKLVKENQIPWAQFYDGQRWQNQFGVRYGIRSLPTMWLLDKKGVLRDMNGRADLESKVEKFLAEP